MERESKRTKQEERESKRAKGGSERKQTSEWGKRERKQASERGERGNASEREGEIILLAEPATFAMQARK